MLFSGYHSKNGQVVIDGNERKTLESFIVKQKLFFSLPSSFFLYLVFFNLYIYIYICLFTDQGGSNPCLWCCGTSPGILCSWYLDRILLISMKGKAAHCDWKCAAQRKASPCDRYKHACVVCRGFVYLYGGRNTTSLRDFWRYNIGKFAPSLTGQNQREKCIQSSWNRGHSRANSFSG